MASFRSSLYALAAPLGDVIAVKKGRIGRRVGRRLASKATGEGISVVEDKAYRRFNRQRFVLLGAT